ncbi:signal recognition particle-docking protein FtsY [Rhizobium sp. LCM 4573]|uniref:signal recognition particle-docking protein FtsY n=1 Tax=Rhizobium sp. LCM 4573 TaxID=1848291 RepID=UPI0008DAAFB6|nr:signal recognition particle-docking protein FtsY [Rhizobium sp. LCM 4573]OHV82165.1 signal recognition particle-docking protein FtsY [Rhizobium sp. LCM 4573]
MALSFIKKVFTFGKEKPIEEQAQEGVKPEEPGTVETELEPKLDQELPVSSIDPVSPTEMETAGGPADDATSEDAGPADDAEDEPSAVLPGIENAPEIGMVPLSLLEAEAEAEEGIGSTEAPPSVPSGYLPLKAEDRPEDDEPYSEKTHSNGLSDSAFDTGQDDAVLPISPPDGEMSGRTEGGIPLEEAAAIEPVLPKGFSSARPEPAQAPAAPAPKLSWFQRLRAGLARTSSQLTGQITALFTKRKLDEDTLEELEDLLIQADLGVETAMRVTGALSSERYGKDVTGEDVSRIMAAEISKVLSPVAKPLQLDLSHKPHVILVVGVNGTGKTTTIGKLAAKLSGAGLKITLAAGDTFRAAAIEQLKIWAERTGSDFIGTKLGADAAGLAYDAYEQAKAKKSDVLIIDTAGRLQNRTELMAELEKIVRVLGKLDPDAPHTVLQTLDATTGQNALQQVEIFRNVAGVSGLIMTKLDGTARGGILVAIAAKHKLPVYFIGVGEGVDDLEPFEADDFAKAIAGLTH